MLLGTCDDDATLGPASSCRDTDFTLAFGDLLSAIVCGLVVAATLWRVTALVCSPRDCVIARWSRLHGLVLLSVKLVSALGLTASALACCVIWPDDSSASKASLALTATSAVRRAPPLRSLIWQILGTALVLLEHFWTLKATALASLWLLATIAVDIARIRSILTSWAPHHAAPAAAFVAQFAFRCVLLVAENVSKRALVANTQLDALVRRFASIELIAQALDSCAPYISRTLMAWLNPLLWRGWRRGGVKTADLPPLARDQRPAALWAAMDPHWDAEARRPLIRALLGGLRTSFIEPLPMGLLSGALAAIQPLLIFALVDFLACVSVRRGTR